MPDIPYKKTPFYACAGAAEKALLTYQEAVVSEWAHPSNRTLRGLRESLRVSVIGMVHLLDPLFRDYTLDPVVLKEMAPTLVRVLVILYVHRSLTNGGYSEEDVGGAIDLWRPAPPGVEEPRKDG